METTTAQFPRRQITKPTRLVTKPCTRCDGVGGNIRWPGFDCFRCGGGKADPQLTWAYPADWSDEQCAEFVAKRAERNRKAREAREAKRYAEWLAQQPTADEKAAREEQERLERERFWNENVAALPILTVVRDHPRREDLFADFVLDVCRQAEFTVLSDRQREMLDRVARKNLKRAKITVNV